MPGGNGTYYGRVSGRLRTERAGVARLPLSIAAAVLTVALTACTADEPSPVGVAEVSRATVEEVVEAPGTVVARATATISSPATGTVATLAVVEGEQVEAGQVLATIDSPQARRQLEQALEADAQAAEAADLAMPGVDLSDQQREARKAAQQGFADARAAAERIPDAALRQQALESLLNSQAQYDLAVAQADALVRQVQAGIGSVAAAVGSLSQAQRLQTQVAVAASQRMVDSLTITSPIAGTVSLTASGSSGGEAGALQLPPGLEGQARELLGDGAQELLGSGSTAPRVEGLLAVGTPVSSGTAILTVTDTSTLSVVAEIDETDVLLVRPGVSAEIELDAVPGASYTASVVSIDPAPTSSGQGGVGFTARMTLSEGEAADGGPAAAPLPGMSAIVALAVLTAENVVAVPAAAVVRDGERDAVYVIERDGEEQVSVRREVSTGAQGADNVEITSGLRAGERIVVSGTDRVLDGQPLP